jgi:hypothetical protein
MSGSFIWRCNVAQYPQKQQHDAYRRSQETWFGSCSQPKAGCFGLLETNSWLRLLFLDNQLTEIFKTGLFECMQQWRPLLKQNEGLLADTIIAALWHLNGATHQPSTAWSVVFVQALFLFYMFRLWAVFCVGHLNLSYRWFEHRTC